MEQYLQIIKSLVTAMETHTLNKDKCMTSLELQNLNTYISFDKEQIALLKEIVTPMVNELSKPTRNFVELYYYKGEAKSKLVDLYYNEITSQKTYKDKKISEEEIKNIEKEAERVFEKYRKQVHDASIRWGKNHGI